MKSTGPYDEHIRLCLRLILQSHLHQLDAGFTEKKVQAIFAALKIQNVPSTHGNRIATLQILAAKLLPKFN